jgi:hypothetical protein
LVLQLNIQNETIFSIWYYAKYYAKCPQHGISLPLLMANVQVITLTEQIKDLQNKPICNDFTPNCVSKAAFFKWVLYDLNNINAVITEKRKKGNKNCHYTFNSQ